MERKSLRRSQGGFTLIEIIAVLVILGILAAVAVPKYVNLQVEAKKKAAEGQVAEIKSALNLGYAKALLTGNGSQPTAADVLKAAGLTLADQTLGTAPDNWVVGLVAIGETGYTINVVSRNGDSGYNATGPWNMPTQN